MPNWSYLIKDFCHASSEIPVKVNSVQTINPGSFFAADYILQLSLKPRESRFLCSSLGEAGCALEFW